MSRITLSLRKSGRQSDDDWIDAIQVSGFDDRTGVSFAVSPVQNSLAAWTFGIGADEEDREDDEILSDEIELTSMGRKDLHFDSYQ